MADDSSLAGEGAEDLLNAGHPPIVSKKRKTATGPQSSAKRAGGLHTLETMFGSPEKSSLGGSAESFEGTEHRTSAQMSAYPKVPGEYTVEQINPDPTPTPKEFPNFKENVESGKGAQEKSTEGDSRGEGDASPEFGQVRRNEKGDKSSRSGNSGSSGEGDEVARLPEHPPEKPPAERKESETRRPWQYSNEAKVYHARYADLDQAYDERRLDACREGCLELLTEPRLPLFTRIQTLQMLSTLLKPASAEACLEEAESILRGMDGNTFQVQLLQEDNERMQADLGMWRAKDLSGKDIEGVGDAEQEDEPSDQWLQHDRDLEEKLDAEVQEELEPFGRVLPTTETDVEIEDAATEDAAVEDAEGSPRFVPLFLDKLMSFGKDWRAKERLEEKKW